MTAASLVQKIWNFSHMLRDDGVGHGDYLAQLTYLLSLKLAHAHAQPPYNRLANAPKGFDWPSLKARSARRPRRTGVFATRNLSLAARSLPPRGGCVG